jgi:hypothetical protein
MAPQSRFRTDLVPDPRYQPSANRPFGEADRVLIDEQIGACQYHLSTALLNGVVATWFVVDSALRELKKGDVACRLHAASRPVVTLATEPALQAAGLPLGIVLQGAPGGGRALVALEGLVDSTITGLMGESGLVRVSPNGRAERVNAYAEGDFPLGFVDEQGWLALQRSGAYSELFGEEDKADLDAATPQAIGGKLVRRAADGSAAFSYLNAGHFIAIGPVPAHSGVLRLSVGMQVNFRDGTDKFDIAGLGVYTDGSVRLGDGANANGVLIDARAGSSIRLRIAAEDRLRLTDQGLELTASPYAMLVSPENLVVRAGLGGASGSVSIAASGKGSVQLLHDGVRHIEASHGTLSLLGYSGAKAGIGVIAIQDAAAIPIQPPSDGCFLWSDGGALMGMGPSGTMKVIAPADPHCPRCGLDFALAWRNIITGDDLAVCIPCLMDELQRAAIPVNTFAFRKKLNRRRPKGAARSPVQPRPQEETPPQQSVERPVPERAGTTPAATDGRGQGETG